MEKVNKTGEVEEEKKETKEENKETKEENKETKGENKETKEEGEKESDELKKLQVEVEEYKEKYLRTLADMNNLSKRVAKEKEDFINYATSVLMRELLPVLDNFDAALKVKEDKVKNFIVGMKLIYKNLMDVLEKEGLKAMETAGIYFDPAKHEVVSIVEISEDMKDGIIVEELRKGYMLDDMVLRPAMVKVAKKKEIKVESAEGAQNSPVVETNEKVKEADKGKREGQKDE